VLAAIVIHAMWHSANPHKLVDLWHVDKIDGLLGILTAVVALTFELLPAMITGIVLSIGYLIYRLSFPSRAELGRMPDTGDYVAITWLYGGRAGKSHPGAERVPDVLVYRFGAPLIFANAEAFLQSAQDLLIKAAEQNIMPTTLVIDFEEMFYVDTTGSQALENLHDYAERYGVSLKLARVHAAAYSLLQSAGVLERIGEQNLYATVRDAVDDAA
jgi:sulfate permease, SulP family